ncbi:MBL fold metallo-hydrolase [Brevibacillus invocatus]|uniref:MBL fold metallo-hydrolase n=1 Tax=Brevibacillus invocatus TaxID=173959 RepID=UPI0039F0F865
MIPATPNVFSLTHRFPYSLYRWATPVFCTEKQTAVHQLKVAGIKVSDIQYVILSHFHADQIGGVCDFPQASFVYMQEAYDNVKQRSGLSAIRAGFLPDLLPRDFERRSLPVDEKQLIGVDVPGHAAGQMGVLFVTEDQPYFLCADAVWSSRAYREALPPHWLTGLILDSRHEYKDSFQRIHQFHREHPGLETVSFDR